MRTSVITTSGRVRSTSSSSDVAVRAVGDDLDVVLMLHDLVDGLAHQERVVGQGDADGAGLGRGRVNASTLAAGRDALNQSQIPGELLERGLGLGLLAAREVDAAARRGTPRASTATWNISVGAHFVDSSRIREPSG